MGDLVKFPKSFSDFPTNQQEAEERVLAVRTQFVDDVLEDVTERLFNDIANYGIALSSKDSHYKDIIFVTESIKALLCRYGQVHHFLHPLIDDNVELTDEGIVIGKSDDDVSEEGNLEIDSV